MSHAQELDTAIDLYNEEQYDECIAHINRVYRDNVPLYSGLRYNILLACCLDDWHEAEVRKLLLASTAMSQPYTDKTLEQTLLCRELLRQLVSFQPRRRLCGRGENPHDPARQPR